MYVLSTKGNQKKTIKQKKDLVNTWFPRTGTSGNMAGGAALDRNLSSLFSFSFRVPSFPQGPQCHWADLFSCDSALLCFGPSRNTDCFSLNFSPKELNRVCYMYSESNDDL